MDVHRIDCENLDIRAWAQEIRQIKIRELTDMIAMKKEIIDSITNYSNITILNCREKHVNDMCRLKDKLQILTR
jgi:hypothetical protein